MYSDQPTGGENAASQGSPPACYEQAPLFSKDGNARVQESSIDQPDQPLQGHDAFTQSEGKSGGTGLSLRDWTVEIGCILLSVLCISAVVLILVFTKDMALSSWHSSIRPNTMISVFSTLAEAFLMITTASCIGQLKWIYFLTSSRRLGDYELFEDASRPVGALKFIWGVNFRAKLAMLGSAIALLSLAVGAFAQQVISYPERPVRYFGNVNSTIFGVATQYDSTVGLYRLTSEDGDGNTGSDNTIKVQQVQSSMIGALLGGLYNLDETIQIACSTGNCSFAGVTTLGISSQCENVTATTTMTDDASSEDGVDGYTYTLPGNVTLDMGVGVTSSVATIITSFKSSTSTGWNVTANWANATLLKFSAINIPVYDSETGNATMAIPLLWDEFEAFQCTLSWTMRYYSNMSVVDGIYSAGLVVDYDLVPVPLPGVVQYIDDIDENMYFPGNYEFKIANPTDETQDPSIYINPNDHAFIIQELQTYLETDSNEDAGKALLSASNLPERIQNITTSMSYAVGQNPNATSWTGLAIAQETYIKVTWEWLALPAAVVLLALVFFIATLLQSRKHHVASWKASSMLPLFIRMAGVEGMQDELEQHKGLLSPADLHGCAAEIMVQFDATEGPVMMCTSEKLPQS